MSKSSHLFHGQIIKLLRDEGELQNSQFYWWMRLNNNISHECQNELKLVVLISYIIQFEGNDSKALAKSFWLTFQSGELTDEHWDLMQL